MGQTFILIKKHFGSREHALVLYQVTSIQAFVEITFIEISH